MLNEDTTTEQMLIDDAIVNGWEYIRAEDLDRDYNDVIIGSMLIEALKRLNPVIAKNEEYAEEVYSALQRIIYGCAGEGVVKANEKFTEWMRNEKTMPFGKDGSHVTVKLIDYENPENNRFVVTHQLMYPLPSSQGGDRFDLIYYINGIPIIDGECKSPTRSCITWLDGANQVKRYERDRPQFYVPNVFNYASEGKYFRYGSIGLPVEMWGPWFLGGRSDEGSIASVRKSASSLLSKNVILDIMKNFTLFASLKEKRIKIVCRYQQYEGANAIIERVRKGHPKKGLIWHFQGSGKSLLMVFAAQKLRLDPSLKNPTVMVVVDRIELDSQMSGNFEVVDIPNTINIESIAMMKEVLKADTRKIMVSTIYKFLDTYETLNERGNIVVMVDEAHRTQYDNLGMMMRKAIPNAFFFGLTGTPINKKNRNTYELFGADEDKGHYLSKYTCADSLRDNATIPLRFEPVDVAMNIDQETINEEFEKMTGHLTDEEKEELKHRASKMKTLILKPERIDLVTKHIAKHFEEKVLPTGFKAMVVAYDREMCVIYKKALDKLLPPEWSKVVIHTSGKGDKFHEYGITKDEEELIRKRFDNPNDELKILIVTSRLITGYSCDQLQTMYLDKPLKEHTLLQAICRVNRPCPPNKSIGVIVDYMGLFKDLGSVFDYDDEDRKNVISNLEELKAKIPELIQACRDFFPGVKREDGYESLEAAQEFLGTNAEKDNYAMKYLPLHRAWEALSPDPMLAEYLKDYIWFTKVYESSKPGSAIGKLVWQSLGQKTIDLINRNTSVEIKDDLPSIEITPEALDIILKENSSEVAAEKIEIRLVARIRRHGNIPRFIDLGKRLEEIRMLHDINSITSLDLIRKLLELAEEVVRAEQEVDTLSEQEQAKNALTELFMEVKNENTPQAVENIVNDIDEVVRAVRFMGWQDQYEGRRIVRKEVVKIVRIKYRITDSDVLEKACRYVEIYYHDEN